MGRIDTATTIGAARNATARVAAYAWGDGARPVLLVHGWGARASRFADLVTALLEVAFVGARVS